MKSPYIKYIAFGINLAIFGIILMPLGAHAITTPDTYTPLAPLPDLNTLQPVKEVSFKTYVTYLFNLLIALGAVAAVFEITWGGFEYMTTDAVSGKTDGLKRIQNAIYGLLLILCSYLILKTIDPRFVSIPSSLVPPLQLNQSYDATLGGITNSYQTQADNATYANNTAIANVNDLQNQLNNATNAVDAACSGANTTAQQCQDALNNEANLQNQLDQAQTNQALTRYNQAATGYLNTVNTNGTFLQSTPLQLQTAIQGEQNSYNDALDSINQNGGDPAALAALQQSHDSTMTQLTMQQEYVNAQNGAISTDQAIKDIQAQQASADAQITDPTMKKQVDVTAQTAVDQLKAKPTFNTNTGSVPFGY